MVYLILLNINESVEKNKEFAEKFSMQRMGIFLIDSLIKNYDQNNPLMGSVYFNPETKRAESNVIDYSLLKRARADAVEFDEGVFIKKLYIEFKSGEKEILFKNNKNGNCLALERFVLIKKLLGEEKAKIAVVVCSE